ncbi:Ig-like domain repeat protein [Psychrobium sp. nBUS_13]|uniref:Ig-like domain repeat protein n=1 Tax=Psychrobium sp. nBUS_13 TaxID=3395319 RepID=UPI003EBDB1BC
MYSLNLDNNAEVIALSGVVNISADNQLFAVEIGTKLLATDTLLFESDASFTVQYADGSILTYDKTSPSVVEKLPDEIDEETLALAEESVSIQDEITAIQDAIASGDNDLDLPSTASGGNTSQGGISFVTVERDSNEVIIGSDFSTQIIGSDFSAQGLNSPTANSVLTPIIQSTDIEPFIPELELSLSSSINHQGRLVSISGQINNAGQNAVVTLTITDANGTTVIINNVPVAEDGSYLINNVEISSLAEGALNVAVTVTDTNSQTIESNSSFTYDATAPNSPQFSISAGDDNVINAAEKEQGINIVVDIDPTDVVVGDTISISYGTSPNLTVQSIVITQEMLDTAPPQATFSVPDELIIHGQVLQGSVTISDQFSNISTPQTFSQNVDTVPPSATDPQTVPVINIPEALDGISAEDAKDGIQIEVTPTSDSVPGDRIEVTVKSDIDDSTILEILVIPANWDGISPIIVTIPTSKLPDNGTHKVTAVIKDGSNNASGSSEEFSININTDSSQPTVFIPEADNGINAVEAADGIQIFVNPPNSATPGSILATTFDNGVEAPQTFQSFIPNDWNGVDQVELIIASADIPNDGTYNVTVAASLPFLGQLGEPSIPQSVTIDTSVPGTSGSPSVPIIDIPEAVDGINIDEFIDGIQINATLPSDVVPGDTVVITISNSNGTPVSFEIEVPSSWQPTELLPLTVPPELFNSDGTYSITATVKDQVGNISQPSITQDIELNISTNKPVVSIPEAEGGINKEEAIDGIEVIIIPPEGTKVGDTIKVSMHAEGSDTPIIIDIPVPSSWNGFGPINYTIDSDDAPTDGTYTVTTIVVDENLQQVGEVSESQNITIDTLAPGDVGENPTPIIEIAEATDGIDAEESKDGIQVLIYPPSGTLGSDTITVTLTSSIGSTPVVTSYVIPDDWNGSDPISVTIPPEELPADGQHDISANVTDKVGNTSSDSPSVTIQLDTASTKPTVYVKEAENGINAAEVEDGIQIQIKLPTGTEQGDSISVSITSLDGSVETNHLFTVPDGWTPQERLNVTFPTDKVPEDGSYEVTASVSKIGQSEQGELSEKESIFIDTTAPGSEGPVTKPIISTPEVTGPFVNESMLTDGLQVVVQPPSGSIPGDLIEVNVYDSNNVLIISVVNQIPVDWEDPQTITVNVNKEILTPDGLYSINTIVRDASGNPSLASDNIALNVDSTAPGEGEEISRPILVAAESENGINKQELSDDIQTELTLPDGTSIGDTIVFTISAADGSVRAIEIPVTAEHFNNDELIRPFPIEIPQSYFTSEQTYTVSVHVKDPAGNPSNESEKVNLNVDTIAPGENTDNTSPQHEIAEAVDGVNAQEMLNGVQISVKVPIGTLPGDTINVLIQNESIGEDTYAFIIPLNWVPTDNVDFTIPNSFYPVDGEYNITSSVSDLAGNISESSTTSLITVDTTPPGNGLKPKLEIPESEGTINKEESIDGIDIIVTPPAGTLPGDSVTVTITGEGIEPQITVDYIIPENWVKPDEIPYVIPTTVLPGDGEYKVIVSITDPSGNTSEPSSPVNIELNTTVPGEEKQPSPPTLDVVDGDNGVNSQEFTDASGVAIAIGLPSDSQVGDIITLTVTDSSDDEHTVTHTVTAQNITDNSALVTVTQLTGVNITDGQYDISAVVTRGPQESKPSDTAEFTLDRTAPGQGTGGGGADDAVLIAVPEQVDGGNIDAAEASDGILVNVTPPIGSELGDTITLTLTDADGNDVLVEHTIEAPWAQGGVVAVTIPVSAISDGGKFVDGDYTVSATVTDQQGNESAPSDNTGITLATDTDGGSGAVTPPIISLPAADDGLINKTELDGLTLTITPPADAQPNGVINVTLTPATGPTVVVPVTIPSTWVAGDTIDQLITSLNHGDKITVTATITKDDVDSTSTPIDFTVDTQPPGTGTGEGGSDAAPGVTIAEAIDNVTLEEANDGVEVLVTPPTDSLPGDTITLTVTQPGGAVVTVEQVINTTWDGTSPITVTIPVSDISVDGTFNDGDYAVSATITDEAGNTSLPETATFTLDTSIQHVPELTIEEAQDNLVDAQEASDGLQASVKLTAGALQGDSIVITLLDSNGHTITTYEHVLTSDVAVNESVAITVPVTGLENGNYTANASVVSSNGNAGAVSNDIDFKLDTTIPGEEKQPSPPTLDVVDGDNGVNSQEFTDASGVAIAIGLPSDSQVGDIITLTVTDSSDDEHTVTHTVTAQNITDNSALVTVTQLTGVNITDGQYDISAVVTRGPQESKPSDTAEFTLDRTAPGQGTGGGGADDAVLIAVPEQVDGGNIDAAEASDGILVNVTPPIGSELGDTITLTLTDADGNDVLVEHTIEAPWAQGGVVAVTIPVSAISDGGKFVDGDYTVSATVTDQQGNESAPSDNTGITLATDTDGGSGAVTPPIISLPAADDGLINKTELDGLTLTITPPADAQPNGVINVTLTPATGPTVVVPVTIPSTWVAGDTIDQLITSLNHGDKITVTATITKDDVDSTSTPIDFTVDTQPPGTGTGEGGSDAAPGVTIAEAIDNVTLEEANDGVEVLVTPPTDSLPGDTITLTVTQPGGAVVTVEQVINTTWDGTSPITVTIPVSDISVDGTFNDGDYAVSATITDEAGNTSLPETATFTLDTSIQHVPELTIEEAQDNLVDAQEASDGLQASVKLTAGALQGDSIVITLLDSNGHTITTYEHVLTSDVAVNESVAITVPVTGLENGNYTANASVVSSNGNAGAVSNDIDFKLDTTIPGEEKQPSPPTLDVVDGDNGVNSQEFTDASGVAIAIGLPSDSQVGDIITLTVTDSSDDEHTVTHTVTAQNITDNSALVTVTQLTGVNITDGQYDISAVVTRGPQESKPSDTAEFTLDRTAPGQGTGGGGADDAVLIAVPEQVDGGNIDAAEASDGILVNVTPPIGSELGDTITLTLTDADGNDVLVEHTIEAPWAQGGVVAVTIPVSAISDGGKFVDGDYTVSATVTDQQGNESAPSDNTGITLATDTDGGSGAVTPPIISLPAADDGLINKTELDGLTLTITPPADAQPNGVINVTLTPATGPTVVVPVTIPSTWVAGDTIDQLITSLNHGDKITVTATITKDGSDSTSTPIDFTVDTQPPGTGTGEGGSDAAPGVTIAEAIDNVTLEEANDGVEVLVTPPTDSLPGDTITLTVTQPGGAVVTVEQVINTTWDGTSPITVTIPVSDISVDGTFNDGDYAVSATITDEAGNTSLPETATFTLDTSIQHVPELTIEEAQDNLVDAQEASDGLQASVKLTAGALQGDSIVITLLDSNGHTITTYEHVLTSDVAVNESVAITVPVTGLENGNYTANASVVSSNGNAGAVSNDIDFKLDTTIPGEEKQPSPPTLDVVDGDNGVNSQEFTDASGVAIAIGLPSDSQVGDIITLTVTDSSDDEHTVTHTVTAQNITDNSALVTVTQLTGVNITDGQYDISAVVTRGPQESKPSDTAEFTLDRTAPGQGTGGGGADDAVLIAVPEQVDGGNIDAAEASDGILVNVTPPIGSELGDTITLTLTDADGNDVLVEHTIEAPWAQGGVVAVTIPVSAISDGGKFVDGDYTVSATVTDQQGNESAPSDNTGITLATDTDGGSGAVTPPIISLPAADDGLINKTELDGLTLTITPPADAQPNGVINVTLTPATGPTVVVPVTIPSTWVAGDTIDQLITSLNHGDKITVTATITKDDVDSTSTPIDFTVDTQPPGTGTGEGGSDAAPGVTIAEAIDNVTLEEANDGVEVLVTPPTDSLPGDTITLTVTQPGGAVVTVEQVINTTWDGTSPITVTIPVSDISVDGTFNDGDYAVSATITDEAGNTSLPETATFTLDTSIQHVPELTIEEAQDNLVDAQEASDGLQASVKLTAGALQGDSIVITLLDSNGHTITTYEHVLTSDVAVNESVAITVPVTGLENGNYTANASVVSSNGNAGAVSNNIDFKLDTTIPGEEKQPSPPTLDVVDGDNGVNSQEFTDASGVAIAIGLPSDSQVGDIITLTVTDSSDDEHTVTHTVTAQNITDNSALVTVTQLTGVNITDGQYDISAVVTRGPQESKPSDTAEFTLDRTAPGQGTGGGGADDAVLIAVPEQVDGGNIDAAEASDGILVNVTPPIGSELGDTITLTLTDADGNDVLVEHTIEAPWAQGGVVAVTIPVSAISDGGKFVDGDYTVSATVTDQQGNESAPSDNTGITLATDTDGGSGAVTPPIISLPAADDGLINKTELDGLTLTITPPADAQPNGVINVTLTPATGPTVVVPVTIPSTWVAGDTIDQLITSLNHGDKITVTATITKDGSDSTSTPIDFTVDTQPPGTGTGEGGSDAAPGVTIAEAIDNVTLEEANDGVEVLVTPPTDSLPGDTITLTVTQPGGAVVTVEQVINATWDGTSPITVTIPVSDISVDGAFNDGDYAVSATITDEAGNTSLAGTENFTLDTAIDVPPAISIKGVDAASGDTIIDAEEIQNTGGEKVITVSVSLPDGTEVGDTIRLFVSTEIDPQGFIDTTIPLGTDLGQPFTIEVDAPEDGDYSIAAQIIDTAGQTSSKSIDTEFTIDTKAHTIILEGPGVDVVEGQATGEYTITLSKEVPAGESVTVFLEYSGTADDGDDFTGRTSVEIGAGQTSVKFNLQTIDDAALEENETLTVTLKNVVDTNNATGTAGFATLPVIDRNQDQATINITPDPAPVDEKDIPKISVEGPDEVREGEEAVFTFKISDEPSELFAPNLVHIFGEVAVAIIVEVSGVDTISGQNVTEEIRLFINVGQSEITHSVTSIADSLKEETENITVSIKEILNNIPSQNPNWNFGGFESAPIISPTNGTATTRVIDQQFEILDAIDLSESNDFSSTAIRGIGGTVGQLVELLDQSDLVIGSGFVKTDGTWEVEVNSSVTANAVHTIKAQLFEGALDSSSVINTTDEISYLKSNSEETTAQITNDNAVEQEFIFTGLSDDRIVVSVDNPNSLKVDGGDGTDTLVLDAYDTDFIAGLDDDGNVTLTYRKGTNKVITLIDIEKVAFVDNTVDVNDLRDTRIVIRDGDGILKSTDLSHKIYIGGQLADGHTPEDIVLVGTVGGRSIVHTISKDNITVTDDGMFFVDVDNLGAITFDGEDVGFNDATQLIAFMKTRDADGLIHDSVQDESIIHTRPPEAVAKITEITEDDGLFDDDFITTDNQLTISGTISKALLEDETLQIFVNNEWITIESSSLVSINGTDMFTWSYVDNRSLPDGEYEYRAQVIDDLGLSSSTSRQVVIVDQNNTHNSGAQVSFTNVLADTGVSDSDYRTNYAQYLIKGEVSTKLQDDEKVQILVGTEWVDLTIQSTISPGIPTVYNWFYRVDKPLDDGVYDYQARIVSAAGHIVGDVVSQSITVDKTLTDTEISIKSLGVDPITGNEQDTGLSNSDFHTNVNSDIVLIGQLNKNISERRISRNSNPR